MYALDSVDELLRAAERAVSLTAVFTPLNLGPERARLGDAWRRGAEPSPRWLHVETPRLDAWRRALDEVAAAVAGRGPLGVLYAARARELELEAAIVEARGGVASGGRSSGAAGLAALVARRFPVSSPRAAEALDWAEAALARPVEQSPGARVRSDDASHPWSLLSLLRQRLQRERFSFRVEVSERLVARATVGDGVVSVRPDVLLTQRAAERLVVHEVSGHAAPRRAAARGALGLLRAGTAESGEHEEGRALLLERRAGFLDNERCFELALRHVLALAVREGADWHELVRLGLGYGAGVELAVELAVRAHCRAPLARELAYLPALLRVEAAFAAEPALEAWFTQGRVGLGAARVLARSAPRAAEQALA